MCRKFAHGVRLILLHPDIAARSCEDCVRYLYYDRGPNDFGERVERGGIPIPRGKSPTPCMWCPKIPAGARPAPENAIELSLQNLQAWTHYRECKAVGSFPHDAIVRMNAGIVAEAEAAAERMRQARSGLGLLGLLAK